MDVYAAPEWHYWIGILLTAGSVATVAAVVLGYFVKVVRPKYPPGYKKPTAES